VYSKRLRRLLTFFSAMLTIWLYPTPASLASAERAQGTLFYDLSSITLVNTGQITLEITPLIFVRDDPQSPARFEGRSWSVQSLAPGECVQLRIVANVGTVHESCQRLVRWQWNGQITTHFWIASHNAKQFRVVLGSTDLLTCEIGNERCVFSYDTVPIVETLILTYDTDTLVIRNGSLTSTPLARLAFCRTAVGPVCVQPREWRPPNGPAALGMLNAGACIELMVASPARRGTCVASYLQKSAFWREQFTVISPITARATRCPGVPTEGAMRCMVPR
jgi:hypothetical protein